MRTRIYLIIIFVLNIALSVNAQDFEISPVNLKFMAEPGQTQSKSISVTNHSNKVSAFVIKLSDFEIDIKGRKKSVKANSTEHSLANWISINPPFVEINPNETRQIIVSMQAPVGDYSSRWAYIYVRNTAEQTAFSADKSLQTGLNISGQIAVEVYQSPKSNKKYRMKISDLAEITTQNDTVRIFTAMADNIGEKITDCKVSLLASNLSTTKEIVLQTVKFKSFPDTQRELNLSFKANALPAGKYALAAILDYGKQSNLEGSQIMITIK